MRRTSAIITVLWLLTAWLAPVTDAWARPTTSEQARTVVLNWLRLHPPQPLGAAKSGQIKEVRTFNHEGAPAYYVVYLYPAGLVLVPADDLVEPIIGFLPGAVVYDPSPANPLGVLVGQDIPGRVLQARELEASGLEALAPETLKARAQRKWAWLSNPEASWDLQEFSSPSLSDVRVAPFVQSHWDQTRVFGQACYNYYTPPNEAGNAWNYPCGCAATAMAQVLRYWQYPILPPIVSSFPIWVDGVGRSATIRGGDGVGGTYDWKKHGT